jgi:hypothetical protein
MGRPAVLSTATQGMYGRDTVLVVVGGWLKAIRWHPGSVIAVGEADKLPLSTLSMGGQF